MDEPTVIQRCKAHLPGWQALKDEEIQVTRMGGLSNIVCRVKAEGREPVLYRMFLNQIGNKEFERVIFREASAEKIGPELLFEGDDFRIEAFFDGKPITVWEMRNPAIMMQCCDMLARYNFNPKIRAACELVEKCDKNKLYIDTQINSWAPEVQARIQGWRAIFGQDPLKHQKALEVLDQFEKDVLFDGFQEFFSALVPRDMPIVIAHNDCQENNILKSLENNCKVLLIDYEYSGWNTMAHELANYLNECVLDNAHPCGSGIAYYPENEPTAQEVTAMLTRYLQRYWEHVHGGVQPWDTALTDMLPGFELAVKKERILCLFFVMIWAFKILKEEDVADPSIYHFEYVGYQLRYLAWMRKTWGL